MIDPKHITDEQAERFYRSAKRRILTSVESPDDLLMIPLKIEMAAAINAAIEEGLVSPAVYAVAYRSGDLIGDGIGPYLYSSEHCARHCGMFGRECKVEHWKGQK